MKVLVIASHFDDEILGCGGSILKHVDDGDDVFIVYIATATSRAFSDDSYLQERKDNSRMVVSQLGVKKSFELDFPLIYLDQCDQFDLVKTFNDLIDNLRPDIIYTHYPDDMNSDHRIVAQALRAVIRPTKFNFIKTVYYYEVFGSTNNFIPNCYIDISNFYQKKLEILSIYESEIKSPTRTLNTIERQMFYRGAEIYTEAAEAFCLAFSRS